MKKEIKGYLHLYLGCQVMDLYNNQVGLLSGIITMDAGIKICVFHKTTWHLSIDEVKLILRPLSSMTEEEIVKLFLLKGLDYSKDVTRTNITENFIQIEYKCGGELLSDYMVAPIFNTEQFRYLLSHHFDLFNLIESNLAIDAGEVK